jgi:hypothetical protein
LALKSRLAATLPPLVLLLILVGMVWAVMSMPGCANGMTTAEAAFAVRAGLILEGDPTPEQLEGLVRDALSHAESRLDADTLEAVRLLSVAVLALYESDGDWRAALVDMLAAIETGAPQ